MSNQTEPYLSRFFHSRGVTMGIPVSGTFELTPCCNLKCRMCYVRQNMEQVRAAGGLHDAAWWLALGEEAAKEGLLFLLLTGGEPLTHPDFKEIYTGLKKMGLMVSINTNGTLIDEEMADFLAENAPSRINMTLYGAGRETYGKLCGQPEAFNRALEGLKRLRERNISVKVNVSVTPYNREDMDDIIRIAHENGAQVQCAAYMFPPLRRDSELVGKGDRFTPEEAAGCLVHSRQLLLTPEQFKNRAENMRAGVAEADEHGECMDMPGEPIQCRAGRASCWITWDGRMLPCGMMTEPAVALEEFGYADAWKQIRRMTEQIRLPGECASCSKRHACSVCAASCLTETGRFDGKPSYLCRMTDAVMEETEKIYKQMEE